MNFNNELKKYLEINKRIKRTKEDLQTTNEEFKNIYRQHDLKELKEEKIQNELTDYDKKIKQLEKAYNIQKIESNLIYNNMGVIFYENYNNKIIDILKKYENKNIGDKTKEKIQNEITDLLKQDFNFEIYVYLHINKEYSKLGSLSINFKKKCYNNEWSSDIFKIDYEFWQDTYNCYEPNKELKKYYYIELEHTYSDTKRIVFIKDNEIIQDMEYIENTKEIATKIFNHSIKAKKEIENYTNKMKEIRNKLNEDTKNLSYSLSQELEIDYKILL